MVASGAPDRPLPAGRGGRARDPARRNPQAALRTIRTNPTRVWDETGGRSGTLCPVRKLKVTGTYYYNGVRLYKGGLLRPDQKVELKPEPENPHDRNAVSVRYKGEKIGHLTREMAAKYQPLIIQGWGLRDGRGVIAPNPSPPPARRTGR
ncbi:HIRAN domain-containing protein [Roseovarius sp.]